MRISFVGHASILIESKDISLLTDPWWVGPCFGAQWWIYPKAFVDPLDNRKLTHIYLSHGHNDHLHPGTLAKFDRQTKLLVAKDLDLAPWLRTLGFTVLELSDGEEVDLGSRVKATIRPTINDDSLRVVSDGKETCVNLNDALHATPPDVQQRFIAWLKRQFPKINYLFCGYGTASHFPNCYRIPGKDYAKTAALRQHHFNAVWAHIVQELQPEFAFPFAADVLLLDRELFWANEPVHNSERPVSLLNHGGVPNGTQAIDMAPGFVIDSGEIKQSVLRTPVQNQLLLTECKSQIERANYYAKVLPDEVDEVLPSLRNNLRICEDYLQTFPGSYRVLLRLKNSERGIEVSKIGNRLQAEITKLDAADSERYDLIFITRLPYLNKSLNSPHGNEIMFVGSGCLFDFPTPDAISRGIHVEVRHIVQQHGACPPPRYGGANPMVRRAKQLLKKGLGMAKPDLYDLRHWTIFEKDDSTGL